MSNTFLRQNSYSTRTAARTMNSACALTRQDTRSSTVGCPLPKSGRMRSSSNCSQRKRSSTPSTGYSHARSYGKLQAWLYPVLGVLDRFLWLQFDELRILPDFGSRQPTIEDRVSCRVSAQALFIVIAALRVLYEFWRKKVLDIFL